MLSFSSGYVESETYYKTKLLTIFIKLAKIIGNVRADKNNGHVGVLLKNSKNMVHKRSFMTDIISVSVSHLIYSTRLELSYTRCCMDCSWFITGLASCIEYSL